MPITVPGTAKFRMEMNSMAWRPGKRRRITRKAMAMPRRPARGLEVTAMIRVSLMACAPTPKT